MMEAASNLKGLEIYAPNGIFVGIVTEVILDIPAMSIDALFVSEPSPVLVDEGICVSIPMRWVASIGDVIILNAFPERVTLDGVRA